MEIIPIIVQILAFGAVLLVVIVFLSMIISKFRKNPSPGYKNSEASINSAGNELLKPVIKDDTSDDSRESGNKKEKNRKSKNNYSEKNSGASPRYTVLNDKLSNKNNYDILDLNFRSYNSDNSQ